MTVILRLSLSFATIWIFARLRQFEDNSMFIIGFATIWIFARLRHGEEQLSQRYSFATIWIFARLRLCVVS